MLRPSSLYNVKRIMNVETEVSIALLYIFTVDDL